MVASWIVTFVLIYLQDVVRGLGEDVCFSERKGTSIHCEFGCCGNTDDKECCDPLAMKVGIGIGCALGVVIIVTIIVCCIKHQNKVKNQLRPKHPSHVTMVQQADGPPMYPGLHYQPNPGQKPPPGYQVNPAYPPPEYSPPGQQSLYGPMDTGPAPPPYTS